MVITKYKKEYPANFTTESGFDEEVNFGFESQKD